MDVIEKPKPDLSKDKLYWIGWGIVYCPVCAPKSWSAEKVGYEATLDSPPGTSVNRWVVSEPRERKDDWNGVNQKPCPDSPDRVHWLLNC